MSDAIKILEEGIEAELRGLRLCREKSTARMRSEAENYNCRFPLLLNEFKELAVDDRFRLVRSGFEAGSGKVLSPQLGIRELGRVDFGVYTLTVPDGFGATHLEYAGLGGSKILASADHGACFGDNHMLKEFRLHLIRIMAEREFAAENAE